MLTVLYEDNHCLAVAKPAGLLTQSVPPVPSLEALAREYLQQRYGKPGRAYLGIPHRLDRPVSGVVLFARQTTSAQRLAEQFRERQVTKVYWALVEGRVQPPAGTWSDWLLKLPDQARTQSVPAETPGARAAQLDYRVLAGDSETTALEIQPATGRMHQIRVQSAARGWPIAGDAAYGARTSFGPPAALKRDCIIALHARSLTFLHPIRFEPITLVAPLPDYWRDTAFQAISCHASNPGT